MSDPIRMARGECHALSPHDLKSLGSCVFRLEYETATESGDWHSASESQMDGVRQVDSFVQTISRTVDRRELLRLIGSTLLDVYPAASCAGIHMLGGEHEAPSDVELSYRPGAETSAESMALPADVRRAVFDRGRAILRTSERGLSIYAPLAVRGDALGVLQVSASKGTGIFSLGDLDLLDALAAPAAIALQNSRLHEASLHQARLSHDLALAARIQRSFLPREVIAVEGLDLFAEYRAAYTVGGDFYDVFWVGPDRLAVFVGDISGKGISAALLMARISSELRVAALAHVDPVAVLTTMNTATLGRGQPELFFTAIYFTLDVKTGEIVLANAGHTTPYSRRADGIVEAVTGGRACPVGILDDPGFTATRLHLHHGDSLVLYTDGVVEAEGADGSFYGQDRLEACLAGAGPRPANVIAEHILRSVDAHAAHGPMNDDLTLLICQRSVGAAPTLQPRRRSSRFPATLVPRT